MWRHLYLAVVCVCAGCGGIGPSRDTICHVAGLAHGELFWRNAAARDPRVHGRPVLYISHGGTRRGEWYTAPDVGPATPMVAELRTLRKAYPTRQIVVISCNPGGHRVTVPGVFYATKPVWSVPRAHDWHWAYVAAEHRFKPVDCEGQFADFLYTGDP